MLKHRIIPVLLYDGSFCVQTVQFKQPARRLGPMEQYVNNMANRNVDELMILDINATKELRKPLFNKIKQFTANQFCPVSYGGGIDSLDDISKLIQECGIDKIVIKTNVSLIYPASRKFGSQSIVYAQDEYVNPFDERLSYTVGNNNDIKRVDHFTYFRAEKDGAGEILLTDINRQGKMQGYAINLIKDVCPDIDIPVIANGGCGAPEDMVNAIRAGASAVAASSMFALRGVTPQDCARTLQAAGLPARVQEPPPE